MHMGTMAGRTRPFVHPTTVPRPFHVSLPFWRPCFFRRLSLPNPYVPAVILTALASFVHSSPSELAVSTAIFAVLASPEYWGQDSRPCTQASIFMGWVVPTGHDNSFCTSSTPKTPRIRFLRLPRGFVRFVSRTVPVTRRQQSTRSVERTPDRYHTWREVSQKHLHAISHAQLRKQRDACKGPWFGVPLPRGAARQEVPSRARSLRTGCGIAKSRISIASTYRMYPVCN
jgi:hypothetical protein